MKSIVIGYTEKDGKGALSVFAAGKWVSVGEIPSPGEAAKIVSQIKASKDYPKGINRVELCELNPRIVSIVVPKIENREALEKAHAEARKKAEAEALAKQNAPREAKAKAEAEAQDRARAELAAAQALVSPKSKESESTKQIKSK